MYTDMQTISYFETADDHYESDDFTLCYLIMKPMLIYESCYFFPDAEAYCACCRSLSGPCDIQGSCHS